MRRFGPRQEGGLAEEARHGAGSCVIEVMEPLALADTIR